MNNTKLTRREAAAIAKDLVEGGIDDPLTITVTAESHCVTKSTVRQIRAVILKNGFQSKRNSDYGYSWTAMRNDRMCSMVEAIANGWEDESLNLTA